MRKLILGLAALAILVVSCNDDADTNAVSTQDKSAEVDMSDFYVYTDDLAEDNTKSARESRNCHSMKVLNEKLKNNPGLEQKMFNIEKHTRQFIAAKSNGKGGGKPGGGSGGGDPTPDNLGVISIPVYVHVVYSTSQQNISDNQINSQITVLNNDFRKTNNDANQVPSEFAGAAADAEITFTLAGTFRHSDTRSSWGTNDAVKVAYPPISPETHLNIWVCNIGGGILGYAQFPGGSLATDGVVVSPQYFGTTGYVSAPFDGGRTLTHEVGHYLNLRHIWGDGRCNRDDFVADTPGSDRPNYGCPSYPTVHCRSNDMTMNYMDYVDDACMYMFTEGQKSRMRALFTAGGSRETMLN